MGARSHKQAGSVHCRVRRPTPLSRILNIYTRYIVMLFGIPYSDYTVPGSFPGSPGFVYIGSGLGIKLSFLFPYVPQYTAMPRRRDT